MLNISKEALNEIILNALETQKFADWYNNGNFDKWISGDGNLITGTPSKEQIEKDIERLFNLDKLS